MPRPLLTGLLAPMQRRFALGPTKESKDDVTRVGRRKKRKERPKRGFRDRPIKFRPGIE